MVRWRSWARILVDVVANWPQAHPAPTCSVFRRGNFSRSTFLRKASHPPPGLFSEAFEPIKAEIGSLSQKVGQSSRLSRKFPRVGTQLTWQHRDFKIKRERRGKKERTSTGTRQSHKGIAKRSTQPVNMSGAKHW